MTDGRVVFWLPPALGVAGFGMALAAVFGLFSTVWAEPIAWIVIGAAWAALLARMQAPRPVLSGLLTGAACGLMHGATLAALWDLYLQNNPGFTAGAGTDTTSVAFRVATAAVSVVAGIVLGTLAGLVASAVQHRRGP